MDCLVKMMLAIIANLHNFNNIVHACVLSYASIYTDPPWQDAYTMMSIMNLANPS